MPDRKYSASTAYRYGFNGKENDPEVKGTGAQYDYGFRIYDPRIGKFLSVDPLAKSFPWYSPYHFAGNNPIQNIDLDGGEPQDFREKWIYQKIMPRQGGKGEWDAFSSKTTLGWISYNAVYDKVTNQYWFVHQGNDGQHYYWKHNPGANQMEYITGAGKANGSWEKFTPYSKPNPADALTAMTVGPLVAVPGALVYSKAALTYLAEELLEEALGFPIFPDPGDLVQKEINKEVAGEVAEQTVRKGVEVPEGWITKPSKKNEGVRHIDPNNSRNVIREMPADPDSPFPSQQVPYIKYQKNGVFYDVNGNKVKGGDTPEAHIPRDQFDQSKMPKFE